MKLIIYTAMFGNYDVVREPLYKNKNIKYICYTDKEFESKLWDVRVVPIVESSARKEARKHKILSHKYIEGDLILWIDASCCISKNPIPYFEEALKRYDIIGGPHRRDCIYDEADKCIRTQRGDPKKILQQIGRYKAEGYPVKNGLINTRVLLRRMTPEVIKFENDWWHELNNGCVRDQVSFNYAIWKNNLRYGFFDWRNFVNGGPHVGKLLIRWKADPELYAINKLRKRREARNKRRRS